MSAPAEDAWMNDRGELAMLASYMDSDGWSVDEIIRMIEDPSRYADLYVLARAEVARTAATLKAGGLSSR